MSEAEIIELANIKAEYDYVESLRCTACGSKVQATRSGSQRHINGRMHDIWHVTCLTCQDSRTIVFSVPPFNIIDIIRLANEDTQKIDAPLRPFQQQTTAPSVTDALDLLRNEYPAFRQQQNSGAESSPATRHFQELVSIVDRDFIARWLRLAGEKLPHDLSINGTMASLIAQMGVMETMQQKQCTPADSEQALDFAMKFVETLWPTIPFGAQQRFGPQKWRRLHYRPLGDTVAIWHNINVEMARHSFKTAISTALGLFPRLSDKDRQEVVSACPSVRAFQRYFGTDERELVNELGFGFLETYQRLQIEEVFGAYQWREQEDYQDFFRRVRSDSATELAKQARRLYPVIMAHRTRLNEPPAIGHKDSFTRIMAHPHMRFFEQKAKRLIENSNVVEEMLLQITAPLSYETARLLLMSDTFLTLASGRDARSRDASGFSFWSDLNHSSASEFSTPLLSGALQWMASAYQELKRSQLAQVIGHSPLCLFLALVSAGIDHPSS